ncbi:hypothetical protein GN956_G10696 [Arapaima gigas]
MAVLQGVRSQTTGRRKSADLQDLCPPSINTGPGPEGLQELPGAALGKQQRREQEEIRRHLPQGHQGPAAVAETQNVSLT